MDRTNFHQAARFRVALLLLLTLLLTRTGRADDFQVLEIARDMEGRLRLSHESDPAYYYVLYRGGEPIQIATAVQMELGVPLEGTLTDTDPLAGAAFYRVLRVPIADPLDTDGDGIDDVYELLRRPMLNPLDPTDAELDHDEDGFPTLQEYLWGTDPFDALSPALTTIGSSPAHRETGVAVTRETVLHFSAPLEADTALTRGTLRATFGGVEVLSRVELSSDRRRATLFYLEDLPPSARVRVTFDAAGVRDRFGREVDANRDGEPGGVGFIDFDTLTITPVPGTAVIGYVYASEFATNANGEPVDRPLEGVIVTVDGAEETLRAVTDADGFFRLEPCPAGRFFVSVDGRTAVGSQWPDGDYYPFVGKAWEAQAGYTDNLAGGNGLVFLPLIRQGTLQPVSATEETVITFPASAIEENPALAGVAVFMPPNNLLNAAGTRGGSVGIAPVPPDRLPEPLPPGLEFPLVITIQTDGPQNFDQPVPVRFPNLPDPVTGEILPPGAKTALWSFNHDTGRWEIQGSMTVTEDGNYVESDPGIGVLQPGWHGAQPGTEVEGEAPVSPTEAETEEDGCAVSHWTSAQTVYAITKEAFDCAKDLGKIRQGIECGVAVVTTTAELIRGVIELEQTLTDDASGVEQAQAWLALAKAQKERVLALMVCFEEQSPVGRAEAVFNCIGNLLGAADSICGHLAEQEAMNPDNPRCKVGRSAIIVCKGTEYARTVHTQASAVVNLAKALKEQFALNALCAALDQSEAIILGILARRDSLAAPHSDDPNKHDSLFTGEEREALLEALESVVATGREVIHAGLYHQPLQELATAIQQQVDSNLAGASDMVLGTGIPAEGRLFYVLASDSIVVRGVTSSGGTLNQIFAPDTDYFLAYYDPVTRGYGEVIGRTGSNGSRTRLHSVILRDSTGDVDSDGDGLSDEAEFVIGTDPFNPDTSGDGIPDGLAIRMGMDPFGGRPVATGVIASVGTATPAVDVAVAGSVAVTANGTGGITMFDVSSPFEPARIAQVNTGGDAVAVAFDGTRIAVANGTAGLAIVDVTDPPAARVVGRIPLGGSAQAVAIEGGLVYVGLTSGQVVPVDLASGVALTRVRLAAGVDDLEVVGDHVYALTRTELVILRWTGGSLERLGSIPVPGSPSPLETGRKLFVGGDYAYVGYFSGYSIVDVSDPANPVIVGSPPAIQAAIHGLAANGSGLLLTTSLGGTQTLALSVYAVTDPTDVTRFLTSHPTPGGARAVAVNNGLAYVASGPGGLQVVNYLAFDTRGIPPTISLTAGFPLDPAMAEEGKWVRVSAQASDDVQVRNVEFYLDGVLAFTDGSFPFEYRFMTPRLSPSRTTFTVQARAIDTGGNEAWTEEISVMLLEDLTPPLVTGVFPERGAILGSVDLVTAVFNEPIDPTTLGSGSFSLTWAGPDGVPGTADDLIVPGGVMGYRTEANMVTLRFAEHLEPGLYLLTVNAPLADLAGNVLSAPHVSRFRVLSGVDSDQDGIPDDWEILLGYDPNNPDSSGNGVLDGDEDLSGDGLPNRWKIAFGYDPRLVDTSGNGIPDWAEDPDLDGLNNLEEFHAGTDPLNPDSDGDGWNDETEVTAGSDPLDPNSRPHVFVIGSRREMVLPSPGSDVAVSTVIARPSVSVTASGPGTAGDLPRNLLISRPPVSLLAPGTGAFPELPRNITLSRPPVSLLVPGPGTSSELPNNVTVARPPVELEITNP